MASGDPQHETTAGARRDDPGPGPAVTLEQSFDRDGLYPLRSAVAAHAAETGLPSDRVGDLVVIANELATNAIRHGGGGGRLRLWSDPAVVYCATTDTGPGLANPDLAGLDLVPVGASDGRGLWIIRQLADAVDIQTSPAGTTVTVSLRTGRG